MALLFFKKYIIATFLVLSLFVGLTYYVCKRLIRPYHLKVTDTGEVYVDLDLVGFDDRLQVYVVNKGREVYLRCCVGETCQYSERYEVPTQYPTPYHYVIGGDLDEKIRHLRIQTDLKDQRQLLQSPQLKQSKNTEHLTNLPVKFKDVGEEVKRKLGVI